MFHVAFIYKEVAFCFIDRKVWHLKTLGKSHIKTLLTKNDVTTLLRLQNSSQKFY